MVIMICYMVYIDPPNQCQWCDYDGLFVYFLCGVRCAVLSCAVCAAFMIDYTHSHLPFFVPPYFRSFLPPPFSFSSLFVSRPYLF